MLDWIVNTLFSTPGLIILVLALIAVERLLAKQRRRQVAKDIQKDTNAVFESGFAWTRVNLTAIDNLDLEFYERTTAEMKELGYRPLEDVECLHVSKAFPEFRTALRLFACGHGQVFAAAYHLPIRGWKGLVSLLFSGTRDFRVVEFESAIDDGRFVISSTTANSPQLGSPAKILKYAYPPATALTVLEQNHIANVQQLMVGEYPPAPLVVKDLKHIMKLQEYQLELEHAHRKQTGPLSEAELNRLAIGIPRKERDKLHAEMDRLRAEVQSAS